MQVLVEYVRDVRTVPVMEWDSLPSEGVQRVDILVGRYITSFAGFSIYWLYQEGGNHVVGAGSVRYSKELINEVVFKPDGTSENRGLEFMPDLLHNQVKLGWWNGKKRII